MALFDRLPAPFGATSAGSAAWRHESAAAVERFALLTTGFMV
jgi:hypothetical protein